MKFFSLVARSRGLISAFAEGSGNSPQSILPPKRSAIVLVGPEELARLKERRIKKATVQPAWDKLLDANKALTTEYPPYTGSNSVDFAAGGVAAAAAVRDLCLVYEVTGEDRYADKAKSIIVSWATTSRNRAEIWRRNCAGRDTNTIAGLGLNVGSFAGAWRAYASSGPISRASFRDQVVPFLAAESRKATRPGSTTITTATAFQQPPQRSQHGSRRNRFCARRGAHQLASTPRESQGLEGDARRGHPHGVETESLPALSP